MRQLLSLFLLVLTLNVHAQHCCHKRDWQDENMAPPPVMSGIGNNHLDISTGSDSAQIFFDQGLRMIHGFWDFEAYRAFKRSGELDPDCAMVPLGIAIVHYNSHNDEVTPLGKEYMDKAKALCDRIGLTEKENNLIEVYDELYKTNDFDRLVKNLEGLCKKYPEELEFQLLLAGKLIDGYEDGKPTPLFTSCDSLLNIVLGKYPDNFAAHHYYIHNIQESPLCEKGLHSAEVIAGLAPAIGHIQHMPGHIYYYLGEYQKARETFLKARNVDSLYLATSGVHPVNHWNNFHNMVYLAFNDLEQGRYKEALTIAKNLQTIEMTRDQFDRGKGMKSGYLVDQMLANGAGDWDRAIALTGNSTDMGQETKFFHWKRKLFSLYAHGMKAFENNQADSVKYYRKKMNKHLKNLKKNLAPGMNYEGVKEYHQNYLYNEVWACELFMSGKAEEAYDMIDTVIRFNRYITVGDPPVSPRFNEETKIRFLLKEKRYEEVIETYQRLLDMRKKSPTLNYELATVYAGLNNKNEALKYLALALEGWKYADSDLKIYQDAKALKAQLEKQ